MADGNALAPIIIKKKKVISGGGHHGGAWKVAYADFVTAMMAFFMLMWLLNATTEKQRKGIADHFNPSVPINRISGGGDGAFGGDSIFSENTLAKSGTGTSGQKAPWEALDPSPPSSSNEDTQAEEFLEALNATLIGQGGESDLMQNALKHVISRVSDEGVVVEIFDLPERPLFASDDSPLPILDPLLARITEIALGSQNQIAIKSHTRTEPFAKANVDPWRRTMRKSLIVRQQLEDQGMDAQRFERVTGKADTDLFTSDPLSVRNNRVEIIFLISGLEN